jgi:hypothetical protein
MAAKNTDSKRIFDNYINRYLTEVARSEESDEPGKGVEGAKKERVETIRNAAEQQSAPQSSQLSTTGITNPSAQTPGSAPTTPTQSSMSMAVPQSNAAAAPQPTPAPQQTTPQPTPSPQQPATPQGAPSDAEQSLLKKLHASDYNPKSSTDQKRLEELRTAQSQLKQKLGREPSLQELATVSYAQQYGEKSPYYAQAQKMGINLGKPGQVVQQTSQQGGTAQQANSQGSATLQTGQTTGQGAGAQQQSQSFTPQQQDYMSQFVGNMKSRWATLPTAQKEFLLKNFITPLAQLK